MGIDKVTKQATPKNRHSVSEFKLKAELMDKQKAFILEKKKSLKVFTTVSPSPSPTKDNKGQSPAKTQQKKQLTKSKWWEYYWLWIRCYLSIFPCWTTCFQRITHSLILIIAKLFLISTTIGLCGTVLNSALFYDFNGIMFRTQKLI